MTTETELNPADAAPFLIECTQGTPEWHQARVGLTTASTFSVAVSVLEKDSPKKDKEGNPVRRKGDPTAAAEELANDTAMEVISEEPYGDTYQTFAMKRGSEEEWRARDAYQRKYDCEVDERGLMVTADRQFGYSTDGAVVGTKGGIEVKTPMNTMKITEMLNSSDTAEYDHQIQGGMWICGWEWIDFIMWLPSLSKIGNELYVKRVYRNDDFIDKMVAGLLAHRKLVMERVAFFSIPHDQRPGMAGSANIVTDVVPREIIKPAEKKIVVPKLEAPEGLGGIF